MPAGIDADVTDGAGSLSAGTTGTNPSSSAQRMAALGFGWADVTATQVYPAVRSSFQRLRVTLTRSR
jgi:hypothetical protein